MENTFNTVLRRKLQSNTFDLSHDVKTSFNMGELVPNCIFEVLPGETYNISSDHLMRVAPMLAPIMHIIKVYQHWFYMPTRLVWSSFEDFATAGIDGTDSPAYPIVRWKADITDNKWSESTIPDYLQLPITQPRNEGTQISAVPFAMEARCYSEHYRDNNIIPELDTDLVDGDNTALMEAAGAFGYPRKRAWEKDYFTTLLPQPQRGVAVRIPIGTTADLVFDNHAGKTQLTYESTTTPVTPGQLNAASPAASPTSMKDSSGAGVSMNVDVTKNTTVDLTTAIGIQLEELRELFMMQGYLEQMQVGGARYSEMVKAIWNTNIGDDVLQRTRYIGGSQTPLIISEVLQTSETTNNSPQGNMAGRAISVSDSGNITYTCKEAGYVMGIVSVMPKPGYFQGMHKHWLRLDKFDFFLPSFQNLGEQAVTTGELYWQDTSALDNVVLGYQARWAEYKWLPSVVCGAFRSSLLFWHMAREFATAPTLSQSLIDCNPTERIFAVQSVERLDHLWCHFHHNIRGRRPIAVYNIPAVIR